MRECIEPKEQIINGSSIFHLKKVVLLSHILYGVQAHRELVTRSPTLVSLTAPERVALAQYSFFRIALASFFLQNTLGKHLYI